MAGGEFIIPELGFRLLPLSALFQATAGTPDHRGRSRQWCYSILIFRLQTVRCKRFVFPADWWKCMCENIPWMLSRIFHCNQLTSATNFIWQYKTLWQPPRNESYTSENVTVGPHWWNNTEVFSCFLYFGCSSSSFNINTREISRPFPSPSGERGLGRERENLDGVRRDSQQGDAAVFHQLLACR